MSTDWSPDESPENEAYEAWDEGWNLNAAEVQTARHLDDDDG